ncbi:MAG: pyridoxine 5'-phosphate synthase [Paracoccaceae bacterium]|tara:strand:- start:532 stop:1287 length:756 start_codon:yes stop_codon:yes gene_type:complete
MVEESSRIRLGVNIDHVATLRNARGTFYPDPLKMVKILEKLDVDGITMHLREDRRHIIDKDVIRIIKETNLPINLEMAATEEMQNIATELMPNAVCLVPERREERTTEGGLDVISEEEKLNSFLYPFVQKKIRISLFVSPVPKQIEAASRVGANIVELNTGTFCDLFIEGKKEKYLAEFEKLTKAANFGKNLGLEIHGGHGLTYDSVRYIASIPEMKELNIGHFLISQAVFDGIEKTIYKMRLEIDKSQKI